MKLTPVGYHDAPRATRELYDDICKALQSQHLPLFFSYIGNSPELLAYITPQIIQLLDDPATIRVLCEFTDSAQELTNISFSTPAHVLRLIHENPSSHKILFHELNHIHRINMQLAFIFVAIRESIKTYAPIKALNNQERHDMKPDETCEINATLLREEMGSEIFTPGIDTNTSIEPVNQKLAVASIFDRYMRESGKAFEAFAKTDMYVRLRVGLEQLIQMNINQLHSSIQIPNNVLYTFTKSDPKINGIIYLLFDHFPTIVMQRLVYGLTMRTAFTSSQNLGELTE